MSVRKLDPEKVRAVRRRAPAPRPAGEPLTYVLHFGRLAFAGTVHRDGCVCPRTEPQTAALVADTWGAILQEPITARLLALGWRITRAPCTGGLA